LVKNFQVVELELQQTDAERDKALTTLKTTQDDLETLRRENLLLQKRLSVAEATNVLPFPTKREDRPPDQSDICD
jgi:hypothetical protein